MGTLCAVHNTLRVLLCVLGRIDWFADRGDALFFCLPCCYRLRFEVQPSEVNPNSVCYIILCQRFYGLQALE